MLTQKQVLEKIGSIQKTGRVSGFGAQRATLKYFKRLHIFKSSNVSFDPATCRATSYNWWEMVKVIGGLVVFNDYRYSPSTSQHQSKVRQLMTQLGIKIDMIIEAPRGLQDLEAAKKGYLCDIEQLQSEMLNPRSNKTKNVERAKTIDGIKAKIVKVEELQRREAIEQASSF